jgi:hypothetical protein
MKWPKKLYLMHTIDPEETRILEFRKLEDGYKNMNSEHNAIFPIERIQRWINTYPKDKQQYLRSIFEEEMNEIISSE